MAKPPIIISNNGLLDYLTQNIEGDVQETIRQRIIDLNNNASEKIDLYPVMSKIKAKRDSDNKVPKYIWHLSNQEIDELNYSIQKTLGYDGEVDPDRFMLE